MAERHPSLVALLVALVALAALSGCSDDEAASPDGSDRAATTTEEATAGSPGPACDAMVSSLLLPVDQPGPDPDALLDAFATVAAEGPPTVAADAATWLDVVDVTTGTVPLDMTNEELTASVVDGYHAVERIHAWALDACSVEGVVWSCPETTVRRLLPMDVSEDEGLISDGEPGFASPQEVLDVEADTDDPPVEVSRTADEVVVAWVDDEGRALEAMTIVEEEGWRLGGFEGCEHVDGTGGGGG